MLSRCKYLYYNLVYLHSWHCWWHLTRKLPILRRHSTKDGCVWPAVFVFDRRLQTMKHYQISTTFISKPDKYKNNETAITTKFRDADTRRKWPELIVLY